ncbi:uncharacterized protein LOC141654869 [Silene latifolia]|uniref:uncharacterized protein LOC141654869 n=1 Tax=Silene latifolia TaxID=37657 RepID=UPI003D76C9B7
MRVRNTDSSEENKRFNEWLLAMGDGTLKAEREGEEDEATWIRIPPEYLHSGGLVEVKDVVDTSALNLGVLGLVVLLLWSMLFSNLVLLCIKDCDQTVERGRELRSDHKMVARALTRKGTTLVKLAKIKDGAVENLGMVYGLASWSLLYFSSGRGRGTEFTMKLFPTLS